MLIIKSQYIKPNPPINNNKTIEKYNVAVVFDQKLLQYLYFPSLYKFIGIVNNSMFELELITSEYNPLNLRSCCK